jgi:16S rRNA (cytosine967-C5)-methyltransferase
LRREADIAAFVAQQASIINTLWHTLALGGTMLYVTCSIFEDENRRQIECFLAKHSDAELSAPQNQIQSILPTTDHDGFYYARLRKKSTHA